ncbi:ABC transporter ATP-binding protein [Streptococcus pneumoniae]|nr:ABC transporter ATP-binding protein [Streptococcus pneumoniae]
MVFQSFNLFENLNVLENTIVAQTTVLKRERTEAEKIAKENLEKVGMGERYWQAKPKQLSGGQKQNDSTFVQSIIGKELQAANIKVKDQAFQNIFTQYIGGGDSSSSSSTSNE